jgi:hypothetical protein
MAEKWTLESAWEAKAPGLHPFAGARLRVFLRHALLTAGLSTRTSYQRFIAWVGQFVRFPLPVDRKGEIWSPAFAALNLPGLRFF